MFLTGQSNHADNEWKEMNSSNELNERQLNWCTWAELPAVADLDVVDAEKLRSVPSSKALLIF